MMCAAFGTSQSLFGATSTSAVPTAVKQVPVPRPGMYTMDKLSFFSIYICCFIDNFKYFAILYLQEI